MKRIQVSIIAYLAVAVFLAGCGGNNKEDSKSGAPPTATVVREQDASGFRVANPEQFPFAQAGEYRAAPELTVTGVVTPDVSRSVPAISLASGRVVEVRARLGDTVRKGQLLMRVRSTDVSGAYAEYRNALAGEGLARKQLERAKTIYEKGAIARKDLEVAEQMHETARVAVDAAVQKMKILGITDLERHPAGVVDVLSPISGIIIEQNVSAGGGVKTLDNSPNLFTIANLDHVWIICDVYENDLSFVRIGDVADVRLNAYPGKVFKGTISNIGPILDPAIRTAKVRIEIQNQGLLMRVGMFVTATFYGREKTSYAIVPATAVLHLQDRDWVYIPVEGGQFRRVEVKGGKILANQMQQVAGINPGQQVVANALALQATAQQ